MNSVLRNVAQRWSGGSRSGCECASETQVSEAVGIRSPLGAWLGGSGFWWCEGRCRMIARDERQGRVRVSRDICHVEISSRGHWRDADVLSLLEAGLREMGGHIEADTAETGGD